MLCGDNGGRRWNGDPCKLPVGVGHLYCHLHGATAPASRAKAERALTLARLPACEALFDIIENWQRATCATCGHPDGSVKMLQTIVKTSTAILDRTGLGTHSTIELTRQSDGDLPLAQMNNDEKAEAANLIAQFASLKLRVRQRLGLLPAGETPEAQTTSVM